MEEKERKERIVLKDGTVIEIENGAVENCVQVVFANKEDFFEAFEKFTEENLESYKIQNADGLTCANYENKVLVNTELKRKETALLASFHLADVDMIQKQLDELQSNVWEIKEGQKVQDGAIYDLGTEVSNLVEGGEE